MVFCVYSLVYLKGIDKGPTLHLLILIITVKRYLQCLIFINLGNIHRWHRQFPIEHVLPVYSFEKWMLFQLLGVPQMAQSFLRVPTQQLLDYILGLC